MGHLSLYSTATQNYLRNFTLEIPTLEFALAPMRILKVALPPTRKPNPSQWNIGCIGSQTQNFQVGHVHFMLFLLMSFALRTQREPSLQWNMGFRPITDCKRPLFRSINKYMDTSFETFSHTSSDQVLMTQCCYMAMVDIASAYCSVSINPDQWIYQGITLPIGENTTYLYDVKLSFGLRCAPFIFPQLSLWFAL